MTRFSKRIPQVPLGSGIWPRNTMLIFNLIRTW